MAKVVIANLANRTRKRANKKNTSVVERRIRDENGKIAVVRTVEALSPTLTEDITYVFKSNVAKARRENQRLVGTPDRAPAKS